jgi:hypothetical protein
MCGGAILADIIPRNRGRREAASQFWPNSCFDKLGTFESCLSQPSNQESFTLKRPQPQPQPASGIRFSHFISCYSFFLHVHVSEKLILNVEFMLKQGIMSKWRSPMPRGRGRIYTEV